MLLLIKFYPALICGIEAPVLVILDGAQSKIQISMSNAASGVFRFTMKVSIHYGIWKFACTYLPFVMHSQKKAWLLAASC